MNKKRPVNLDLRTIKQPLPAITSILHRVTGVALFFGAVFALYALGLSLESE
ncbi:succinate dehydrogenase, cytochrome b556 subunit, partial [Neptuniibacter caesariensis]